MHLPVDSTRRARVVVAETSPLLRSWLVAGLKPLGVQVVEVGTGWELLASLAEDEPPDLVVAGLRLPVVGGAQILAMIRTAGADIPFVLIAPFCRRSVRALVDRVDNAAVLDDPLDTCALRDLAGDLLAVAGEGDGWTRWRAAR